MGEGSIGKLRSEEDGGCDFRYRSQGCVWGTTPDRVVPVLADHLPRSEAVVLDAGCGNGRNAVWLADRGISVHAVDVSAEALSGGRKRWPTAERVRFERADLRTLKLADRFYDAVLACSMLHWLHDTDEIITMIDRLKAATRPGGLHAVVVFNARLPYPSDAPRMPTLLPHEWYLDRYQTWQVLQQADMDSTHTHPGEREEHTHAITRLIARRDTASGTT